MKTKFFVIVLFAIFGSVFTLQAQSIVGEWKTIDDVTHKPKSVVKIWEIKGKYYGKIVKLFPEPGDDPNPKCTECTDYRKNKPIIGMTIIKHLKKDGNEWTGGEILDPESGNIYKCKVWLENGNLQVRGYIGFSLIGRSQTWLPYKE